MRKLFHRLLCCLRCEHCEVCMNDYCCSCDQPTRRP
jgi:hypothetical protein